jgi:flagellar assembly protein FliH
LAVDPEAMRGLIQAALEKLHSQEICRVRMHPSQEALMRSMLERSPHGRAVQFQADPALARGAAIFETSRGNLDASVETQLREIEQGLTDRLERA